MKNLLAILLLTASGFQVFAQQKERAPLYDTAADAKTDIKRAVALAAKEHKNVMLQIGGNWCIWCTRFHNTVAGNDTLNRLMNNNYVVVHVNYEKKLDGKPIWRELGYPQRFGFPVFIILNGKGERLHTQNSEYLEDGKKSYDREKVISFLSSWSPSALDGKQYTGN